MKLEETITKANGKTVPRCQARKAYGSVWVSGREQCSKAAIEGDVFCGTHKRAMDAKLERRKQRGAV
jgi:hypothetical protein